MTESDQDIDELRERTQRSDRIDENDDDDGEERDIEYTPIDEVLLRKNEKEDVDGLREQTERTDRIQSVEDEEVELRPFEEFDFDDSVKEAVDDPYCGNCAFVTFRKHNGKPSPHCTEWETRTNLEPGKVCRDYTPQGLDD